jgi:hypothetical protein
MMYSFIPTNYRLDLIIDPGISEKLGITLGLKVGLDKSFEAVRRLVHRVPI